MQCNRLSCTELSPQEEGRSQEEGRRKGRGRRDPQEEDHQEKGRGTPGRVTAETKPT